jgi:hypothetical protein
MGSITALCRLAAILPLWAVSRNIELTAQRYVKPVIVLVTQVIQRVCE